MARTPDEGHSRTVRLDVRITPEMSARLKAYEKRTGMPRSTVVRAALTRQLDVAPTARAGADLTKEETL